MNQVLWSDSVCQLSDQSDSFCQLSYLPCMYFGLTVSVSWATFHESSPLVWQFLSAELPSMNQVLWSDSVCQLSYLPWIKYFGLTVSVSWVCTLVWQCLSAELPSMYQVLWSDSVCQLSYLTFHESSPGLTVSVSWATFHVCTLVWQCVSWVTFHESSPLVWQCLSAELPSMNQVLVCQCLSAELPSMNQVLWSDSVCQLSYLPWIKSLVWQFLSAELPSMNQVLWSDSVCQLSYLPWIKSFGLTVSVSWATFHESSPLVCQCLWLGQFTETSTTRSLPLVSVSKGCIFLL